MNIYEDSFQEGASSKQPTSSAIDEKLPAAAPATPAAADGPTDPPQRKQKRKRGGCCSCLMGCFGMLLILLLIGAGGAWFAVQHWPNWARNAIVAGVEDSDLSAEDKVAVAEQLDRIVADYKSGNITPEDMVRIGEEFLASPLVGMLMADSANVLYVRHSQLDADERAAATITLQRLARGTVEGTIESQDLERIFNYISEPNGEGGRALKLELSDEELRVALADAKTTADDANVADEGFDFDIGGELARVIDRALMFEG